MKIKKNLMRFISLLLVPCLLIACTGYTRTVLPIDQRLPVEAKIVVLHSGADEFYLSGVEITDSHIRGMIRSHDSAPSIPKRLELDLYVDGTVVIPGSLPAQLSIPFTAIERVEVYDVSTGKTLAYNLAIVGGVVGGILLAYLLLLISIDH